MFKAVIFDLDGTLLHTDQTVSDRALSVIEACRERGIKILLATARPERTAEMYCEIIDFDAKAFSNGARIVCGDKVTEVTIPFESTAKVLGTLDGFGARLTLETGGAAYSNKVVGDYETIVTDDLTAVAGKLNVLKVIAHIVDNREVLNIELPEGLYFSVSGGYYMQIMNRDATKWNGVKAMLDHLGVAPEEAVYFGDDFDDIEPIKMCGVGVAVSNAIDEVKAVADHIAESNDDDGVAKFIERYIL